MSGVEVKPLIISPLHLCIKAEKTKTTEEKEKEEISKAESDEDIPESTDNVLYITP